LEAIRKANILDMDLNSIYNSLKDFRGYRSFEEESDNDLNMKKAIVTICSTGEGTAVKLKELVENIVLSTGEKDIKVLPISIRDINNKIKTVEKDYNIIASVGILNPKIEAPFISLEELIGGQGEKILNNIIKNNNFHVEIKKGNIVVKDLCQDSLNQFLTYLNPTKITNVLYEFTSVLEDKIKIKFNNAMLIRIMVHVGCALERMVLNDGLKYKGDRSKVDEVIVSSIKEANTIFKKSLNVSLNDDEILFISEMLE
jgi:transcriptional regulatory protein LevR